MSREATCKRLARGHRGERGELLLWTPDLRVRVGLTWHSLQDVKLAYRTAVGSATYEHNRSPGIRVIANMGLHTIEITDDLCRYDVLGRT